MPDKKNGTSNQFSHFTTDPMHTPMKNRLAIITLTILIVPLSMAQKLPGGYLLQYQQSFSDTKSLADFKVGNPELWGIHKSGSNFYLQFEGTPGSAVRPSLPQNMAVLNNRIFGDFILEADVMPQIDTLGFGEICLFLGIKDQSRYYCIQLASRCDSLTHGIYVVKDSTVKKLTSPDALPVVWKEDKWQKVRLVRDIVTRTILIYVGDMEKPLLQTKDYALVMGSVGFGSFSGAGQIDNVRIWAPTVIREEY
jgi:hypothetical protein